MKQKILLDQDTYIQSTKDYTGGLCPKCHDEFNMVEECSEPEMDYNNKLMFIPMACDCNATFVQMLKNKLKYNRKTKEEELTFIVFGYSHLCDCDFIDLTFANCECEFKFKECYSKEYDRYIIQKHS